MTRLGVTSTALSVGLNSDNFNPKVAHGDFREGMKAQNPAEERLAAEFAADKIISFGKEVPDGSVEDPTIQIRAECLRWLMLTRQDDWQPRGFALEGASIIGSLNLVGFEIKRRLWLSKCYFDDKILLADAILRSLSLRGSKCRGIEAQRLEVKGSLFLDQGFESAAPVDLMNASIGKRLECDGAIFRTRLVGGEDAESKMLPPALNLEEAEIGGSFLFRNDPSDRKPRFEARCFGRLRLYGTIVGADVELDGAQIYGDYGTHRAEDDAEIENQRDVSGLNFEKARIEGAAYVRRGTYVAGGARFYEARIGALEIENAILSAGDEAQQHQDLNPALDARLCHIRGAFLVGKGAYFLGEANLAQATASMFNVNFLVWPKGRTVLDGFTYDRFATSAQFWDNNPIAWLETQRDLDGRVFHPQPWEQATSVLRSMGHEGAARRVAIRKAVHAARAFRRDLRARAGGPRDFWCWLREGNAARIALQPVYWLAWCWLHVWHFFLYHALRFGHQSLWSMLALAACIVAGWSFYDWAFGTGLFVQIKDKTPPFSPFIYALDVLLPILKLGLADSWQLVNDPQKAWIWNVHYLYKAVGWVFGGFAIAGFSGLVRR